MKKEKSKKRKLFQKSINAIAKAVAKAVVISLAANQALALKSELDSHMLSAVDTKN